MENDSTEEQIRKRAYELWEKDGSPSGQADKYWEEARTSIEKELVGAATAPSETEARQDDASQAKKTSK